MQTKVVLRGKLGGEARLYLLVFFTVHSSIEALLYKYQSGGRFHILNPIYGVSFLITYWPFYCPRGFIGYA